MNIQAAFHSTNGKRRILIVEDEAINREILGAILEKDYEIIYAQDGEEALIRIRENRDFLSLILLDLILPKLPGQEVLRRIREDAAYQDIPVIVASGDHTQEILCLQLGASDFIQKPYPAPGVILARVRRAIELYESRQIIHSTERDSLTGLYNREFFYSYAEQFDQHHPDMEMDAIILDIIHFETINERYGKAYGDEVLKRVGEKAREMVHDVSGIVCRREADMFQVYCPHREDYKAILDNASVGLSGEQDTGARVRLRMGVYSNVDKSLDIERRFARAKMAADTVRNSYTRNIGIYDDTLHKAELYSEQLIEDFPKAIEQKQFEVYFQPKYDIRQQVPELNSAEGLVRWKHPELGLISPGVFIPLFEQNGLIETLDHYVWRETARQIRIWKDDLGYSVPVSVNVSRIDITDPNLIYTLLGITEEYQLSPGELHLEITESAYAEDTEQIIETVRRLRAVGFLVEMDDFGTGYSSLNMLTSLPIDVLKLDMKFIQTAFSQEKDVHMMKVVIEIARHLSAPVVAEGVETEEQMNALKELGCDLVQGYYFSPPVPAGQFAPFLEAAKAAEQAPKEATSRTGESAAEKPARSSFLHGFTARHNISLRKTSVSVVVIALVVIAALFIADFSALQGYRKTEIANEEYLQAEQAAKNMELGSDYLTDMVRSFVVTGDIHYLSNYFEEAEVTRRRDQAVSDLNRLMDSRESTASDHLSASLSYSNELMLLEYDAMKLILSTGDYDEALIPDVLKREPLTPGEAKLSDSEKFSRAVDLVYGNEYMKYKTKIRENASLCTQEIIAIYDEQRLESGQGMSRLLIIQTVLAIVILLFIISIVVIIDAWIRTPLKHMVDHMREKETVPLSGAKELVFVSSTYNQIFEENRRTYDRLTYGNMHDVLTGLYNRSAYDFMRHDLDMSHNALLVIDVDRFKSINDTYGHDIGDVVLKRVAEVLKYSFRSTDLVFRLGGDEFVVIMSNVTSAMTETIMTIVDQANVMLQKPVNDLPPTSISVGAAFADRKNPEGDIFKDADTALYRMKQSGRCGCCIY